MAFVNCNTVLTYPPNHTELYLVGNRYLAPTGRADHVEGEVTQYDKESGRVVLLTDDGEIWSGYEYQLESIY